MRRRRVALALGAILFVLRAAAPAAGEGEGRTAPAAVSYALEPPASGGLEAVDLALRRIETHRRLLVIGAHPDDEDTELLAAVARGMGGEAAYLSLSRGEGGQNLVGPDLGVGLGLVRSQELGAARRLDGGRQFFTRAYDFGFTRSLEETFARWPRAILLEDAVRVVRRFRPQVIVTIFSGTERDGHAQHQASALVGREAYRAAGDPAAAPRPGGGEPPLWAPKALYRNTAWFDRESTTAVVPTGGVDPLTGRSAYQVAMASRSLHRSQDMGALQEPGPQDTAVGWLEGAGRGSTELFGGVDTRLTAVAEEVADPARRRRIEEILGRVAAQAAETRRRLSPPDLGQAAPRIAGILGDLRAARALTTPADGGAPMLLDEKIARAQEALAAAAGVSLDAVGDREVGAPGESLEATVSVWNAGAAAVDVESVALESPEAWAAAPPPAGRRPVAPGKLEQWKLSAAIPRDAPPTAPYFLDRPMKGDLYDWSGAPAAVRGEPFGPAPLTATAEVTISGARVTLRRDVSFRYRDQGLGEVRRPVRAAPAVDVAMDPDILVWPVTRRENRVEVTLVSNAAEAVSGRLVVTAPPGWKAPDPQPFRLGRRGDRQFFDVSLSAPPGLAAGRAELSAAAVLDGGRRIETGVRLIDYGYIPRTPEPRPAATTIASAELALPPLRSVGYVRGAADRVPEALAAVGVPIRILQARDLDTGDLSRFDAILVGSRAYETDPALARANPRLLDYVRAGGLLIVQYQQYAFVQGGYAPFPLEIARPHDRVTDETARVSVLSPELPVFRTPNRIGPSDWEGWVQERGLYFARSWAPEYVPLLAMADPGGPEQRGALLSARVGRGRYVYTGLSFFRQLPAGVPGAYRLLANLLAWKS